MPSAPLVLSTLPHGLRDSSFTARSMAVVDDAEINSERMITLRAAEIGIVCRGRDAMVVLVIWSVINVAMSLPPLE
jgi:hypothetical protein